VRRGPTWFLAFNLKKSFNHKAQTKTQTQIARRPCILNIIIILEKKNSTTIIMVFPAAFYLSLGCPPLLILSLNIIDDAETPTESPPDAPCMNFVYFFLHTIIIPMLRVLLVFSWFLVSACCSPPLPTF
jgi:hypothetical protein